jgi:hypothetical protein
MGFRTHRRLCGLVDPAVARALAGHRSIPCSVPCGSVRNPFGLISGLAD